MIEVKELFYAYQGEYPVLNNISFSIQEGGWLSIMGKNGSGKTTLAMTLNGLLLPSEGEVLVDGISTADQNQGNNLRQKIAYVFQNPENQIVGATVEEDVAFGPCNMGLPHKEVLERTAWALEAVGMSKDKNHEPHMLSGGQKQKVALAGALAMRPKYLILDEACSMLDPQSRQNFWSIVRELWKEYGLTIISISHFPEESLLGTGILLLKRGEVEAMLWQSQ